MVADTIAYPSLLFRVLDLIAFIRVRVRWHEPVFHHSARTSPEVSMVKSSARISRSILDLSSLDHLLIDPRSHLGVRECSVDHPWIILNLEVVCCIS